jgi:hypothetical protein
MADTPQKIEGINQVISELRKLNASSKKDLMRDKEERDRAEKLAASGEVQESQGAEFIDAGADFQRRFLAGQAKTFTDKALQRSGSKLDVQEDIQKSGAGALEQLEKLVKHFTDKKGDEEEEKREKDKDKKDKKKDKSEASKSSFLGKAAKGAAGMGLMGLGIGAFMSGLMVWSNVKAFRGENFPEQAQNISEGWEHFGKMSTTSIATLGVMLAGGAFLGMVGGVGKTSKAALGMTAMGAGIGGFMSGIAMAGSLTNFDGTVFKENASDIVDALENIGSLSATTLATLGIIAGGGAIIATKKPFIGLAGVALAGKAAAGATLGGAAIGGFMTGIAAPGAITKITGTEFKDNAVNIVAALKELETLDEKTLITLGLIAGTGAVLTMKPAFLGLAGKALATKAAAGASIMGAGIGGFMVGMAGAGKIGSLVGIDGSAFKENATNIAEGMGAFTGPQQAALVGFITLGAGLGAIPGVGLLGSLGIAASMTLIGAGIGGFFTGMAGIGDAFGAMGVDGSTLNSILTNLGGGLAGFNEVDGKNLLAVGGGLTAFGLGLAELLIATGITGTSDTLADIRDQVRNFFNVEWVSGDKDIDTSKSGMEKLIDSIVSPMSKLATLADGGDTLGKSARGIRTVVTVLNELNGLKLKSSDFEFEEFTDGFVHMAYGIDAAFNGGKYVNRGWGQNYDIKTGIKNLSLENYTSAAQGIKALQNALGFYNANGSGGNGGTTNNDSSNTINIIHSPEMIDLSNYNSVGPMSNLERARL